MKKPLQILFVEDSEDDTRLMARELERGGYDLTYERVDTPLSFLNALDRGPWDLVIGDHSLPHLDTLAVLTLLKERTVELPFIIVSGSMDEKMALAALKLGAREFLSKNELEKLLPLVNRTLAEAEKRKFFHRVEKSVCESEERFRNLIENAADIVAILDEQGKFIYLNPSITQIVGYAPNELEGKNALEIIHPADAPDLMKLFFEGARQLGSIKKFSCRFRHKNGHPRYLEGVGKNLLDIPSIGGIMLTCRVVDSSRKRGKMH